MGSECNSGGPGKPTALPPVTEPGSGAALLVASVRRAIPRLLAAPPDLPTTLARSFRRAGPPSSRAGGPGDVASGRAGPEGAFGPPRGGCGYSLRELLSMADHWGPGWPAGWPRWADFLSSSRTAAAAASGWARGLGAAAYGRGHRGHVPPHVRAAAPPPGTVSVVLNVDVPDRALTAAFQAAGAAMTALCLASPGPGDAPEHRAVLREAIGFAINPTVPTPGDGPLSRSCAARGQGHRPAHEAPADLSGLADFALLWPAATRRYSVRPAPTGRPAACRLPGPRRPRARAPGRPPPGTVRWRGYM